MHYFIVCKPEGCCFLLHFNACWYCFPILIFSKNRLTIVRKKNLLAHFQQFLLSIMCQSVQTVKNCVKHYHFLYYLCLNCKLLLQTSLCPTCLSSVHLSLLPKASETPSLQGWSQKQNQHIN